MRAFWRGRRTARQRTIANFGGNVMRNRYAIPIFSSIYEGSDPNGIRTRVTAVKGRCPGPLDDRVTKARAISNCCSWTQGKLPARPILTLSPLPVRNEDRRSTLRPVRSRRGAGLILRARFGRVRGEFCCRGGDCPPPFQVSRCR
jgi:hypothetical protein